MPGIAASRTASGSARLAWASFDRARRPFNLLILTYVFAPFFTSVLAPSPARGQAIWGFALAGAGIVVALTSPMLGAMADAAGPKEPWIAVSGAPLVLGSSCLWFAVPGSTNAMSVAVLGVMVAVLGSETAIVFHNALMPSPALPGRIGKLPLLVCGLLALHTVRASEGPAGLSL